MAATALSVRLLHAEAERPLARVSPYNVIRTAAPLLLAIAGSALSPLPCAFSLTGVPAGTTIMLAIAAANDYTTVIMVRAASRANVSGYEEVVFTAGGRRARNAARIALIVLLFGSLCGCLGVIQETSARALQLTEAHKAMWLGASEAGRAVLLCAETLVVVLPLSLASLGDLPVVSLVGVGMMLVVAAYVLQQAASRNATSVSTSTVLSTDLVHLPEAASTFGYAFYIQPCALPLLRTLPAGEVGARTLEQALHLTFAITSVAYLCVGVGGFLLFQGVGVPQDLFTGFEGHIGGALNAFFAIYLMFCFPPILVPLRETLVRLYRQRQFMAGFVASPPSPLHTMIVDDNDAEGPSASVEQQQGHAAALRRDDATLPPLMNGLLTAGLVGAALSVALLLPDESATLFSLTGATGVCFVSYVLPVLVLWWEQSKSDRGTSSEAAQQPAAPDTSSRCSKWSTQRGLPFFVLFLGSCVSALTLLAVVRNFFVHRSVCAAE